MAMPAITVDECTRSLETALAEQHRLEVALLQAQTVVAFWRRRLRRASLSELVAHHGGSDEGVVPDTQEDAAAPAAPNPATPGAEGSQLAELAAAAAPPKEAPVKGRPRVKPPRDECLACWNESMGQEAEGGPPLQAPPPRTKELGGGTRT